jgi:hypothetical protein
MQQALAAVKKTWLVENFPKQKNRQKRQKKSKGI